MTIPQKASALLAGASRTLTAKEIAFLEWVADDRIDMDETPAPEFKGDNRTNGDHFQQLAEDYKAYL